MDERQALTKRVQRERAARKEAESLLEIKSKELHAAVQETNRLNEKLERTVRLQTRELLSAQRVTKLGTFVWNTGRNTIYWTEGGSEILGLTLSDNTSSFDQFLAVICPEDRGAIQELRDRLCRQAGVPCGSDLETEHTFRIVLPDRETRWIKFVCELTDFKSVSGAVLDITDSVWATEQIRQARLELEQRLADLESTQEELKIANEQAQAASLTKSRFMAMISHEIRTPINGLLGTLTLLADSALDGKQKDLLGVATSSAESLRVLVNDIIDFARLETGKIKLEYADFEIRDLVLQLIEFWTPLASSSGNTLEATVDSRVPEMLRGDATRIGQVLNNLISNAIKFTRDGAVTVRVRPDEARGSTPHRSHLVIEVADTGKGISKSDQAGLFKEFSQVPIKAVEEKRSFDFSGSRYGAGLGLAICRALVEQMGGRISVKSSPGFGSTFSVSLALNTGTDRVSREPAIAISPLVTAANEIPHALVADDVPANQLVSRMLLQNFGCQVDIVNDGVEAVAACKNRKYDFVLMDVSMPRMDGIAATRQIRSLEHGERSAVPIIGLTAFAFTDEIEEFVAAGMNEVICKPVQKETLYRTVKSALQGEFSGGRDDMQEDGTGAVSLERLQALASGLTDEQFLKVVDQVSADLDKYRRTAIADAKGGNVVSLARSCHAVKGLAASFGSENLARLASRIEESARNGDSAMAFAVTLASLDSMTDDALKAYKDLRENRARLNHES